MPDIQIHDKLFTPFISKAAIHQRIIELALEINVVYAGKKPLMIGILNGSFVFAADLFRALIIEAEISFIKLASYKDTSSTGHVITAIGMEEDINNRHVIIVEDIIDTGTTLHTFLPELLRARPATLKIASLLIKPGALLHDVRADYVGFEIENKFVVGYGLDYNGLGRNLPDLYILKDQ